MGVYVHAREVGLEAWGERKDIAKSKSIVITHEQFLCVQGVPAPDGLQSSR